MRHEIPTLTLRGLGRVVLPAAVLICHAAGGAATEVLPSDAFAAHVAGTLSFGTTVRTQSPSADAIGTLSAARVGVPPGKLNPNSGGSDLNFVKNRPVSTVLKGMVDVDVGRRDVGFFVRTMFWHDFELSAGDRAYGNYPNGFQRNAPLSDSGFDPRAAFSNARLADAYVYGKFGGGAGAQTELRLGRQQVNWGAAQLIGGGINAINPVDYAAATRPGALPQESKVPVGMAYANVAGGSQWGVEGFLQYEFRPTVLPGCGTFFSISDWAATGCNFAAVLPTMDEAAALAAGLYGHRSPDVVPRDSGQFGLSLRYRAAAADTDVRVYAMNYHSRIPNVRVINPAIGGGYGGDVASRLGDPDGVKYALIYPTDIRLLGASFDMRVDPTHHIYGELSYRPNQPIGLNLSDVIAAFVTRSSTTALNLARATNALPPGASFDAYDRFRVTTATLGASKFMSQVLGAQTVALVVELGVSHVAGLPDPGVLRYGRSETYGGAALNGYPCTESTPAGKSCAHDGFVTANAWGYGVNLAAIYPGALFGAQITPSVYFAHDVRGYSHDGSFLEDRKTLRPSVRIDWGNRWFAELQYTRYFGARYNVFSDRGNVNFFVGMRFGAN